MRIKYSLFLWLLLLLCAAPAQAAPTLLAISESENGQVQTWWPSQYGSDMAWITAFEKQGISVIQPARMTSVRLSPAVYAPRPLSDANARTMASLFSATNVLNGNVTWNCISLENLVQCNADVSLHLLYGKDDAFIFQNQIQTSATTPEMAKKFAITRIAAQIALSMQSNAKSADPIPKLADKPVILFDPLPDADTLVALRKQIKTVPGVEDIAERWVANGVLALELNPAQKTMSQADFLQIIQTFTSQSAENLIIREIHSSDRGSILEVVRY